MKKPDFHAFYQNLWSDRWASLESALKRDASWVAVIICPDGTDSAEGARQLSQVQAASIACWKLRSDLTDEIYVLPHNSIKAEDLANLTVYFLDPASVVVALCLVFAASPPLDDGGPRRYLIDLCAAPGGKSILLRSYLNSVWRMVFNERSDSRRGRLKRNLENFFKADQFSVTGHDSRQWCLHEKGVADAILLDAPCSSEKHVLENSKEFQKWSVSRSSRIQTDQWSMLASSLQVVKPGGLVMYSTCSVHEGENDQLVERALTSKKLKCEVVGGIEELLNQVRVDSKAVSYLKHPTELIEKTKFGYQILPDRTGVGPIYFSLIRRTT